MDDSLNCDIAFNMFSISTILRFVSTVSTVSNTPYAMFQANGQRHNEIQCENSISIFPVTSSRTILISPKLKQLLRILPSNLQPIRIRHLRRIKPLTRIPKRLKRIINREQNPISPNLRHTKVQRSSREMSRRRNPQILRKVLPNRPLTRLPKSKDLLPILEPVVNPPHIKWYMLPQMSKDNLQLRVPVEYPVRHHPENM